MSTKKEIENDHTIRLMRKVLEGQRDGIWSSNHQSALKELQKKRSLKK
jgi:hypothetical protein